MKITLNEAKTEELLMAQLRHTFPGLKLKSIEMIRYNKGLVLTLEKEEEAPPPVEPYNSEALSSRCGEGFEPV